MAVLVDRASHREYPRGDDGGAFLNHFDLHRIQ
jgi:hypothetical protein